MNSKSHGFSRAARSAASVVALAFAAGCAQGSIVTDGGGDVRPPTDTPTGDAPMDVNTGCGTGLSLCGMSCVDLAGDRMNCGTCGNVCMSGQSCAGGTCNSSGCAAPLTMCGMNCIDTRSDNMNCGTCGSGCPVGQNCMDSMCASMCMAPRVMCGATCTDPQSDTSNCGACGTACATGQSCVSGRCMSGCSSPRTMCGATCTDTQSDTANCGACGNACAAGQTCTTGACGSPCPAPRRMCGALCTDVQTDNSNCGACGTMCTSAQMCSGGACVSTCAAPRRMCGAVCTDVATDAANCGTCGMACPAGQSCMAGACRAAAPANDARANATMVTLTGPELTLTGSTSGATNDGPGGCGCTGGANVWYRFTLGAREVFYADTAGSTYDTSLLLTDMAGVGIAGMCNDDGGCSTGGFTSGLQSRISGMLNAGTYYLAVGGCSAAGGAFTLHLQHIARTVGSYFYDTPITGTSMTSTVLVGTSAQTSLCGGTASGEDVRWFVTCGGQQQFLSLCTSDGGTFRRRSGTTNYDPSMYIRSGQTGGEVVCNDDGGTGCAGTGGDTALYGSRLNNVVVPRGINAAFVDERVGGSGMTYTLRYTIR